MAKIPLIEQAAGTSKVGGGGAWPETTETRMCFKVLKGLGAKTSQTPRHAGELHLFLM